MRAHRWIVSLLPLVAAVSPPAAAVPVGATVGMVVSLAPTVNGTMLPQGPELTLGLQSPVCLHMEVATQAQAGARIALGAAPNPAGTPPRAGTPVTAGATPPACTEAAAGSSVHTNVPPPGGAAAGRGAPPFRGALIMGASSKVVVEEWLVEEVTRPKVTLRALLGDFLVFFTPRPRSQAEGKVQIETPAGTLDLHGTALCLRVAPDGTTLVAVLEGEVTVTSKGGGKVLVTQGSWTEMALDRPPLPPSPLDPRIGTLSPHAGGPAFTKPGETQIPDSPFIDLERLTSDLPKARHP